MVSGYTKNLEIQTTPSEISSFEGKKKKMGASSPFGCYCIYFTVGGLVASC